MTHDDVQAKIREAQTVDAACPFVLPSMSAREQEQIARLWRQAVTAFALLHSAVERSAESIIVGEKAPVGLVGLAAAADVSCAMLAVAVDLVQDLER